MKKRLITTLAIVLMLAATLSLPAVAADEEQVTASVTVLTSEIINITLTDPGAAGIQFGSVVPSATAIYGAEDQDGVTPAIQVKVENGTNVLVDISIKGSTAGVLTLENWKYSTAFNQSDIASIPDTYNEVYDTKGPGSYPFYHWISVPVGTTATSYSATISYKAETHT